MKAKFALLAVAITMAGLTSTAYANTTCYVADPSDTPLNVRKAPVTGKVISALEDGEEVEILSKVKAKKDKQGNSWVYIGYWIDGDYREGWVYRNYLRCD